MCDPKEVVAETSQSVASRKTPANLYHRPHVCANCVPDFRAGGIKWFEKQGD
jgi:hypothetical protein